ncbi:hypothetical protein M3Y99_01315600 [Aphelenchoides fujianensis]|nr:hypothetical protein M3Y99_01315600 [Aphelenchoides fujianensis]
MVRTRSQDTKPAEERKPLSPKKSRASPKKKAAGRKKPAERRAERPKDDVTPFREFLDKTITERVHTCSKLNEFLSSARCPNGPLLLKLRGCVVDVRDQLSRTAELIGIPCRFVGGQKENVGALLEGLRKRQPVDEETMETSDLEDPRPIALIHVVRGASKKFLVALAEKALTEEFPAIISVYCNESAVLPLPPSLACRLPVVSLKFEEIGVPFHNLLHDVLRVFGAQKRLVFAPNFLQFVYNRFLHHEMSFLDVGHVLTQALAGFQLEIPNWEAVVVRVPNDFDFALYFDALLLFARFVDETSGSEKLFEQNPLVQCFLQQQSKEWKQRMWQRIERNWKAATKERWLSFFRSVDANAEISTALKQELEAIRKEVDKKEDIARHFREQLNIAPHKRAQPKAVTWAAEIGLMREFFDRHLDLEFAFEASADFSLERTIEIEWEAEVDDACQELIDQEGIVL